MPKKAASHIQKMAPGPPMAIAVATPARFPVPTCAAMAVASDWNELMPSLSALLPKSVKPPKTWRIAIPKRRTCTRRSLKVK